MSYRPPDRVTGEYGYEVSFMGQISTAMHGTYVRMYVCTIFLSDICVNNNGLELTIF